MESDSVCKFFADLRIEFSHLKPINFPSKFARIEKYKGPNDFMIWHISIPDQKIKIEKIELRNYHKTKSILEQYEKRHDRYVIAENPDLDLVYLGCAYLNKLRELLDEYARLFTDKENIDHLV